MKYVILEEVDNEVMIKENLEGVPFVENAIYDLDNHCVLVKLGNVHNRYSKHVGKWILHLHPIGRTIKLTTGTVRKD